MQNRFQRDIHDDQEHSMNIERKKKTKNVSSVTKHTNHHANIRGDRIPVNNQIVILIVWLHLLVGTYME